jgi:IS30 family transposase
VAEKNLGGRPQIEIDWKAFDKLCLLQCTLEEIASFNNCSVDTIERAVKREHNIGFAEYYKKKSAGGKSSLRRKQMEVALSGNTTMLIWLGKQYLEQKDKTAQELTGANGGPVQTATIDLSNIPLKEIERELMKLEELNSGTKKAKANTRKTKANTAK